MNRQIGTQGPSIHDSEDVYFCDPNPRLIQVNLCALHLLASNRLIEVQQHIAQGGPGGKFRDIQVAGQLQHTVGDIAGLGKGVATFAGYYQWMKEDALITIGPGNVAPGSGIVLPGTAAKLLGTKGNIGIIQGKLSIPVNDVVKIPISVTWSNRTELINEKDIRGQVGLTFDLDSLFKK